MTPNGIEMLELPFNRMRLFKKLSRGDIFSVVFEMSSYVGIVGLVGRRFFRPCIKSIAQTPVSKKQSVTPGQWSVVYRV